MYTLIVYEALQSMPILAGLGAYPPENSENFVPLWLNLRVHTFNDLLTSNHSS